MTIISGELSVKPDGGDWALYPAGTAFEIAGRSGFDVRATDRARTSASFCRPRRPENVSAARPEPVHRGMDTSPTG